MSAETKKANRSMDSLVAASERPDEMPKPGSSGSGMALYPHPDLPLFPAMLIELVGSRNIILTNGRAPFISDFATLTPCDLCPEDLQQAAEQIAEIVQTLAYSRKSLAGLMKIRLNLPTDFSLSGLCLSDRARVALQSKPFFDPNGPWRQCSILDVLANQAMGSKLLIAFLLAVEAGQRESKRSQGICSHLEADLAQVVRERLYSPRSADVFMQAQGWDGQGRRSLLEIAATIGVSKERCRQVLALASTAMATHLIDKAPPVRLQEALSALQGHGPLNQREAQQLLVDLGLTSSTFDPSGLLSAAQLYGLPAPVEIENRATGVRFLLCESDRPMMHQLQGMAKNMVRSLGLISDLWLLERARSDGIEAKPRLVQAALCNDEQLSQLTVHDAAGPSTSWYWAGPFGKPSGAIVRALKIISFFGSASTSCIAADLDSPGACADLRLPGQLPRQVIEALLSAWGLTKAPTGEWRAETESAIRLCEQGLPDVERQVALLFKSMMGATESEQSKSALRASAMAARINPNTLQSYLRRSPLMVILKQELQVQSLSISASVDAIDDSLIASSVRRNPPSVDLKTVNHPG